MKKKQHNPLLQKAKDDFGKLLTALGHNYCEAPSDELTMSDITRHLCSTTHGGPVCMPAESADSETERVVWRHKIAGLKHWRTRPMNIPSCSEPSCSYMVCSWGSESLCYPHELAVVGKAEMERRYNATHEHPWDSEITPNPMLRDFSDLRKEEK